MLPTFKKKKKKLMLPTIMVRDLYKKMSLSKVLYHINNLIRLTGQSRLLRVLYHYKRIFECSYLTVLDRWYAKFV